MIFYTSDLHFGHENIIKSCGRPFSSADEMDEALIAAWNARVTRADTVYILGDLIYKAERPPEYYLKRLKGKKCLIVGNHDSFWLDNVNYEDYFEDVSPLKVINSGAGIATLCHFPMLDFEGRWHIHGHIHNNTVRPYWPVLRSMPAALNAGADINNFVPVTFEELVENNTSFKASH